MYKIKKIFNPLYDYFNQEIIYYILKIYKIKYQWNIGFTYARDHFYYYVKQKKK
jgi:hypothetical protein